MTAEREFVFEMVSRMRESEAMAKRTTGDSQIAWLARARAYNEVYTESRGLFVGEPSTTLGSEEKEG